MKEKLKPISKEFLETEYIKNKKSTTRISKEFNISITRIVYAMRRYGIKADIKSRAILYHSSGPRDILTKELLELEYVQKKQSLTSIAEKYNIKSTNSVAQAINRYGLTRRDIYDFSEILTKEYLIEHYVKQKKALRTIAQDIGHADKRIIKKYLKKHGIRLRTKRALSEKARKHFLSQRVHPEISGNYYSSLICGAIRRNFAFEISINRAWEIFVEQDKKCALTGLELKMRDLGGIKKSQSASFDRIDSSKGYVEGNMQWIHKDLQRMKWNMDEAKFINYCKLIVQHKG